MNYIINEIYNWCCLFYLVVVERSLLDEYRVIAKFEELKSEK